MARLLWRDAQGIEGTLDLSSTEIKVGRSMDCAIRTDDAMVSRHHARIFWGGGGYVLEDLSSANGVYFQEQRVQSHLLKHGDAVRCGSLWLRFVDTAQLGGVGGQAGPAAANPVPMMQHSGMGAIAPAGPTGHVAVVNPSGVPANGPMPVAPPPVAAPQPAPPPAPTGPSEADVEIRVLRRRVEQLQTELRIHRSGRMTQENARKMEDLENDFHALELERDNLKSKLANAEGTLKAEAGSVKVQRAVEIAAQTAEASASLNDLLSSLRIEVMAAEGEFEQYSNNIPRASYELIRQSLRDAAGRCDEARELLRRLREVAE
ncbi:MAG: FHA domain-containing protein [Deltaproteobacteria bacterium]|nr:FHA domain-containing protein [Deltaproteobacteria bacterium]MCW5804430.1 FHA domain-containing protein [Deltaproteobacteria bacterium]